MYAVLRIRSGVLCMPGKYSTKYATPVSNCHKNRIIHTSAFYKVNIYDYDQDGDLQSCSVQTSKHLQMYHLTLSSTACVIFIIRMCLHMSHSAKAVQSARQRCHHLLVHFSSISFRYFSLVGYYYFQTQSRGYSWPYFFVCLQKFLC